MPRASTGASIKAKTFLASSAGYQPGGKMSIVDRSTGLVLLPPERRDRPSIPASETANLATCEACTSTGKEIVYVAEAQRSSRLSGDGALTKRCHQWIEQRSVSA